jgi:hypothetical protein
LVWKIRKSAPEQPVHSNSRNSLSILTAETA